jgi:hypothetical protein
LTPGASAGSPPVSFYIGRRVNFGLSTGQRVTVSNGWIALGDASNAALFNNGTLRVVPAGGTVDSTPQLLVNANQPADQTGLPTPPIDFAAAFAPLNQNSAVTAEHHQGVAGSNGGEVHKFPFVGTIDCATTPPTTTTTTIATTTTTTATTTTTVPTTTTTTPPTTSTTSTTVVPTSTTDPGTTTTAISPTSIAQSTTTTDPILPATGSDSHTLLLAALTIAGIGCLVFAATTFPAPE